MTFTLTLNGETATFTPAGEYTEIEITNTIQYDVHEFECINEWTGACRPLGTTRTETSKGKSWTEITTAKARTRYAELKAQGWVAA